MNYDIIIVTAEKDFVKIKFVYNSIIKNLEGFDKIYCISNVKVPETLQVPGVLYFLDGDAVDFDFSKFTGRVALRKGWYIQQYIKLFQTLTQDNYLVVDADAFFNRKVNIIENDKPSFLFGRDQCNQAYFTFMKEVFNLDKVYPYSFINESMFFKREIINHMSASINVDKYGFFDLSVKQLNKMNHDAGISEYELYGNYVTKHFKDSYNYKYIKSYLGGKYEIWKESDVQKYVDSFKGQDVDIVSMHSWV